VEINLSRKFGAIRQIAFVVPDIDAAMEYWSDVLGVGPFFVKRRMTFSSFTYRGRSAPSPCISIALANSGEQQIELIAQHDDVPSIYLESLHSGRPGFHHLSSWLGRDEFDIARSSLLAENISIAQECTIASSGVRLIYWATEEGPNGLFFEISDVNSPEHRARVDGVRQAAAEWDGDNAVVEVKK